MLYEDLAFDAQQAVEKAIKGLLAKMGIDFPKTHALVELLDLVEASGTAVPEHLREAGRLTVYAVETRYPGIEEVTKEEYLDATMVAEREVDWVESRCCRYVWRR